MTNRGREIFVLLRDENISEDEVEQLNQILKEAESPAAFCACHELVNRNYITSSHRKIIRETKYRHLRPFRFLIARN